MGVNSNDVPQYIYKLQGLGMYSRDLIPGLTDYTRNFKGNAYGVDIHYEYSRGKIKWLSSGGIQWRTEDVIDGITIPRAAGKLEEIRYNFLTSIVYQPHNLVHNLRFTWEQYDRSGREFFQDFNVAESYETISSPVLTTSLNTYSQLTYELIKPENKTDYQWMLTGSIAFSGLDNMYLYPRSRQIADRAFYNINAKKNWRLQRSRNLQLGAGAGYISIINSKTLNITMPSTSDFIARELFLPDHGYLSSNSLSAQLSVQYAFHIPSVANTMFYIRGNGGCIQHTGKEKYGINGNRTQFAVTLGALY
jgi:hypothetical protein